MGGRCLVPGGGGCLAGAPFQVAAASAVLLTVLYSGWPHLSCLHHSLMKWSRSLALPSFSLHNSLCSYADDPQIKLAISFALAQSTKLSVLEERTRVLGRHLSRLPVFMAETGEVPISEKQIMQVCVCVAAAAGACNRWLWSVAAAAGVCVPVSVAGGWDGSLGCGGV